MMNALILIGLGMLLIDLGEGFISRSTGYALGIVGVIRVWEILL